MGRVYIARCIVRKNGQQYEKGDIIEGLTETEIRRGLAQHWLTVVGNEKPTEKPKGKKPKKEKETNPDHILDSDNEKDKLIAQAQELGLEVTDAMTDGEIQALIDKAQD